MSQDSEHGDRTGASYWNRHWKASRGLHKAPHTSRAFRRFLTEVLDAAGPGAHDVLELGCAPGTMIGLMHALRPNHRYAGLDYDAEHLAAAGKHLESVGISCDLVHGDLRQVEPQRRYDIVVSFGLVEHFDDPASILRHHARLAEPGGLVAVTIPNYTSALNRFFIQRMDPKALEAHNLAIMSVDALHNAATAGGLAEPTAGGFGPCKIRSRYEGRTVKNRAMRLAAVAWNGVTAVVPGRITWHGTLWARGRAPAEDVVPGPS